LTTRQEHPRTDSSQLGERGRAMASAASLPRRPPSRPTNVSGMTAATSPAWFAIRHRHTPDWHSRRAPSRTGR
jgi:hypothetical protein